LEVMTKKILVKTISRSEINYTKEIQADRIKIHRNLDPTLHPLERAREYTRALNAVKLDKIFAKPFVGDLHGHKDGVFCMAKHTKRLSTLISGSCDGEIRVWNISTQKTLWKVQAHSGFVRGLCFNERGDKFISCGDDSRIALWEMEGIQGMNDNDQNLDQNKILPITNWSSNHTFTCIDFKKSISNQFITGGNEVVELWDINKSVPLSTFSWGSDTLVSVKFNPSEMNLFGSTASDRSIALYDLRGNNAIRKLILNMRSNTLCWNPMRPSYFTVANEDHNLYTFDMRFLNRAVYVYKDHVSAVLDVDYSPTGREIVSGSYDHTIRIWPLENKSREVYHTSRMQRIFCVKYSQDSKYVLSGSDDTNIRIWKANASDVLGTLPRRKQEYFNYLNKLKERYKHATEIKRIAENRHLPSNIFKAKKLKHIMKTAEARKFKNVKKHSKKGSVKRKDERKDFIVKELA